MDAFYFYLDRMILYYIMVLIAYALKLTIIIILYKKVVDEIDCIYNLRERKRERELFFADKTLVGWGEGKIYLHIYNMGRCTYIFFSLQRFNFIKFHHQNG